MTTRPEAIYVLHAFEKRQKTSARDLQIGRDQFLALRTLGKQHGKAKRCQGHAALIDMLLKAANRSRMWRCAGTGEGPSRNWLDTRTSAPRSVTPEPGGARRCDAVA